MVKRIWVGFAEPPVTHLSLEALTGMDIANLPVLRKHLRHVVMRCLMPLTEPRYLVTLFVTFVYSCRELQGVVHAMS